MFKSLFKNIIVYLMICFLLLPVEIVESKSALSYFSTNLFLADLTPKNKYNSPQTEKNSKNQQSSFKNIKDNSSYNNEMPRFEANDTNIIYDGFNKGRIAGDLVGRKIRCDILKWKCL
jgi:hypothetical protein